MCLPRSEPRRSGLPSRGSALPVMTNRWLLPRSNCILCPCRLWLRMWSLGKPLTDSCVAEDFFAALGYKNGRCGCDERECLEPTSRETYQHQSRQKAETHE